MPIAIYYFVADKRGVMVAQGTTTMTRLRNPISWIDVGSSHLSSRSTAITLAQEVSP
jgi:hypothetical protein